MAIICQTHQGWLVDHQQWLDKQHTRCHHSLRNGACKEEMHWSFRCKPDLFDIQQPFLMDSQFKKMQHTEAADQNRQEGDDDHKYMQKRKKKRKRKTPLNEGETRALEYHLQVRDTLHKALQQLKELAHQQNYFVDVDLQMPVETMSRTTAARAAGPVVDPQDSSLEMGQLAMVKGVPGEGPLSPDNNKAARAAALVVGPGDSLVEMSKLARDTGVSGEGSSVQLTHNSTHIPFNTLVHQSSQCDSVLVSCLGHRYLLPPKSSFLMSDFSCLGPLLDSCKFNFIILDPPWQNKSVKRKKMYDTISDDELLKLPLSALAEDGALVAVWVTNKQQQHQFVKEQMFPQWGVKPLTQWYWLKVTKSGMPVCDLDAAWKKPYETLILGKFTAPQNALEAGDPLCRPSTLLPPSDQSASMAEGSCDIDIPCEQVIVSVPCSIHSRKPPLTDIMEPYVAKDSRCLEMFARNLSAGWTSWGNEVLRFQHTDFFVQHTEDKCTSESDL